MGVAIALAVLFGLVIVAALRLAAARDRRDPLLHCPICAADAVSALQCDAVDDVLAELELRCGDCGTWRRLVTTRGSARLHELSLERHVRAMRKQADRLERDRVPADAAAFASALRLEITGADDFLARTQASSPP